MASESRGQVRALGAVLRREPYRFEFAQALRVLRGRPGGAGPGDEPMARAVSFRSSFSLAFPTSDIAALDFAATPAGAMPHVTVTVNFLGLGGALGPLPPPFSEYVNAATRRGDTAPRDFIDLFNHRFVALAETSARLFRPVLEEDGARSSRLAQALYAVAGLGTPKITRPLPPGFAARLIPLTALLHQRPVSAHAIERAVVAMFGIAARVLPFRGRWLQIDAAAATALGRRNHALGSDAILGGRVWDQSAAIALVLGPVPLPTARRMLPGEPECRGLATLIDVMTGDEVAVRVALTVDSASIPAARLGRAGALRLGWTAWLGDAARDGTPHRAAGFALPPPALA